MGIFKKIFKGVGKVFKKIGKGVKSVFKKFGKFMGKIGIAGQIAMMFILPGIGAQLMKGFGAMWTSAVGQTAAQATATSIGTAAGANATTKLSIDAATKVALEAGKTTAQQVAAGEVAKQAAIKAATKAATVSIRAGTQAITQQATGMLASEYAIVKGAGMVLQKGAQFASTIASGYQTVSQAVTGVFTETGKWIGGKLGMKTAEGVAMKGSWANYSKAVTDSFADFKGNMADFWSPIKDGPTINVGIKELTNEVTNEVANAAGKAATSTVTTDISTPTTELKSQIAKGAESTFTPPEGFDVTDPLNLERPPSLLDRAKDYITGTPDRLYKGAIDFVAQTPGRVLKSEATGALYDAAGLTGEEQVIEEEQSLFGRPVAPFTSYSTELAQTLAPDNSGFPGYLTGLEQTVGPLGVKGGFYGGQDGGQAGMQKYYELMKSNQAVA